MNNLDTTFFIAISGLIISILLFLVSFYTSWRDRSKIKIKTESMKFIGPNFPLEGEDILRITAINKGRRPVILSEFGIEYKRGIPLETIYGGNSGPVKKDVDKLPKKLDEGDSHIVVLYEKELRRINRKKTIGKAFFKDKTGKVYRTKRDLCNNSGNTLYIVFSASILSVLYSLVDFFDFWINKLKIEVRETSMHYIGPHWSLSDEDILELKITNRGKRPVILSEFGIEYKGGASQKIYKENNDPVRAGVNKLPKELGEGETHIVLLSKEKLASMNKEETLGKAFFRDKTGNIYRTKKDICNIIE